MLLKLTQCITSLPCTTIKHCLTRFNCQKRKIIQQKMGVCWWVNFEFLRKTLQFLKPFGPLHWLRRCQPYNIFVGFKCCQIFDYSNRVFFKICSKSLFLKKASLNPPFFAISGSITRNRKVAGSMRKPSMLLWSLRKALHAYFPVFECYTGGKLLSGWQTPTAFSRDRSIMLPAGNIGFEKFDGVAVCLKFPKGGKAKKSLEPLL